MGAVSVRPITRSVREIFQPYHDAIAAELDARAQAARATVLCAMHSFTRHMGGITRPWDIGIIHGPSSDVADALIAALGGGDLRVGRNQPWPDALSVQQVDAMNQNVAEFAVPFFGIDDQRQGIVHVIGPEQGLTQPAILLYGR